MKKIAIATLVAVSFAASAADYVSVDVDHVKDVNTKAVSQAQYIRAGKEIGGLQFGLQSRTAVAKSGGMFNSIEGTVGKSVGMITPFIGVGYDNGANGVAGKDYTYGLVGATTGMSVGPGYALIGGKTRIGSNEVGSDTKQTVAFGTYSLPITKAVAVNLNASKSYQDIKENAYGLGLSVRF